MLKVSALYLEKQKSFISKKIYNLGRMQSLNRPREFQQMALCCPYFPVRFWSRRQPGGIPFAACFAYCDSVIHAYLSRNLSGYILNTACNFWPSDLLVSTFSAQAGQYLRTLKIPSLMRRYSVTVQCLKTSLDRISNQNLERR